MMVCWLTVYLLVIPGLPTVTTMVVWLTGLPLLALLATPTPFYLYTWVAVHSYYRATLTGREKDLGSYQSIYCNQQS